MAVRNLVIVNGRLGRAGLVTGTVALLAITACGTSENVGGATPTTATTSTAKLTDYAKSNPEWLTSEHVAGKVEYKMSPPVGGNHNKIWQNCAGDVYPAAIANEHAVHSLEHGAVWITYRPGLAKGEIEALAKRVDGRNYMLMSPYPGLKSPISVQAWGLQLAVDSATAPAIDEFIKARRQQGPEPGAPCSGGVTGTGTNPIDLR
jgi:hypothetical protein